MIFNETLSRTAFFPRPFAGAFFAGAALFAGALVFFFGCSTSEASPKSDPPASTSIIMESNEPSDSSAALPLPFP